MKKIVTILFLSVLIFMGINSQAVVQSQVKNDITKLAVNFVTDLASQDFKKAVSEYAYTVEMQKIISESFLRDQVWDFFVHSYGQYQEITAATVSQSQGYDIISVNTAFSKAKIRINIVFDQNKLIAGLNHALVGKTAIREMPKSIQEVAIEFGKKNLKLPGILTIPTNSQKHPVVILVHGSGPNDRDQTIGPNKPFRDIAWGLAERDIASLRYDKRTLVHPDQFSNQFTVYDETIEDALLAVEYLKTLDNIDSSAIFVLGHSLGGMLMPRIAEKSPDARGFIIISAPVTPLEDLLVEQIKYIAEVDGVISTEEKESIIRTERVQAKIKKIIEQTATADELLGINPEYWLDLHGYNPAELAQKIIKPLIIIQGERDYQITMKEFQLWQEILGQRDNVDYISYPGLNHILIAGTGKSQPQEYYIPGQVAQNLIEDLASWVKNNL